MPIMSCTSKGKRGKKFGRRGKCFTGPRARASAARQGRAIKASGFVENEDCGCGHGHATLNRTEVVPSNPLKADPTRTKTLRRIFVADFWKRFERLKGQIIRLVVDEDAFGLLQIHNEETDDGTTRRTRVEAVGILQSSVSVATANGSDGNQQTTTADNQETRNYPTQAVRRIEELRRAEEKGIAYTPTITQNKEQGNERRPQPSQNTKTNRDTRKEGRRVREKDGSAETVSNESGATRSPTTNTRWQFRTNRNKVRAFERWLKTQVDVGIITTTATQAKDAYWKQYVEQAYKKGQGRAFDDVRKPALASGKEQLSFFEGTRREFLQSSFGRPVSIEKVKLLAGRVFTDLQGVTAAMSTQMSRVLTDGLAQGLNPHDIARNLNDRVGKIGQARATVIARTEIIRAHAEGQLDALERLGVVEVGVMVEWSTAGDDRVCPLCQPLEGAVFTIKEARGLIPRHAQCRCAHIPANVGEDKSGQQRGSSEVGAARDRSIKAEIPKRLRGRRTLKDQKALSPWPGASRRIAKQRAKSVLDKLKPTKPRAPKIPKVKVAPKPKKKVAPKPVPKKARPIKPRKRPKAPVKRKAPVKKKVVRKETQAQRLGRKVETTERDLQKLTKERVVVLDKKGDVIASIDGSETSVNTFLRKKQIKGKTVLHNHPLTDRVTPSTFSTSDIKTGITSEVGEMRVVASNGDRFSMKFGNTLKGMSKSQRASFAKQVEEDWQIVAKRKIKKIEKDLVSGKLLKKDALEKIVGVSDEAWESVARTNGLEYKRLTKFKGVAKETKKIKQRAKSVLDKLKRSK